MNLTGGNWEGVTNKKPESVKSSGSLYIATFHYLLLFLVLNLLKNISLYLHGYIGGRWCS